MGGALSPAESAVLRKRGISTHLQTRGKQDLESLLDGLPIHTPLEYQREHSAAVQIKSVPKPCKDYRVGTLGFVNAVEFPYL